MKLPWLILLALLLFVLADNLVFRVLSPWAFLDTHAQLNFYHGLQLDDRIVLEALEEGPSNPPNVVLMGTSRMAAAWKPGEIDQQRIPHSRLLSLAHQYMHLPDIRAAVSKFTPGAARLVVLGLSQSDTHLSLKLPPDSPFPSPGSYLAAARGMGLPWLFENREGFYRTLVGELLTGYRLRGLLGDAGMSQLRKFGGTRGGRSKVSQADSQDEEQLPPALLDLATLDPKTVKRQASQLRRVMPGPHVTVQMGFLRAAVEQLTGDGTQVAIVELPLHPATAGLYSGELRGEFLQFCRELERDFGVLVVPLEVQPSYTAGNFKDLTHLQGEGARQSTTVIAQVIAQALVD